jgi:hypothetical protein
LHSVRFPGNDQPSTVVCDPVLAQVTAVMVGCALIRHFRTS